MDHYILPLFPLLWLYLKDWEVSNFVLLLFCHFVQPIHLWALELVPGFTPVKAGSNLKRWAKHSAGCWALNSLNYILSLSKMCQKCFDFLIFNSCRCYRCRKCWTYYLWSRFTGSCTFHCRTRRCQWRGRCQC